MVFNLCCPYAKFKIIFHKFTLNLFDDYQYFGRTRSLLAHLESLRLLPDQKDICIF